ncbi:HU family DNA-binding protein [Rheinheimera gaetbuli]
MNKSQLVDAIIAKMKGTHDRIVSKTDVNAYLDCLESVATAELKSGGEVALVGLGKLKVAQKAARTGRNPKTGAAIDIPAKTVVKFTPAKALADAIN